MKKEKKECCESNPFVAITSVSGGIILTIIIMFLIFARTQMAAVVPSVTWALVTLGCVMGLFSAIKK